ncbi:phage tail assembly protein [Bosea sp. FBZP-16]|uniref:phage tail assembly protein n=1 Tax=Bosea sp. FBZP-16 TaxID=2065382 RepID=UPI000C2FFDE8|nr:phage tail assembly protein [Bosea sp. FBZP-16]
MTKLTISPQGAPDLVDEDESEVQEHAAVIVEDDEEAKKADLPARATLNANGTVTLKLVKPITLTISKGGKERQEVCAELTFRELTGADLRVVAQEKDEMKRTILTLARATGMSSPRMNVLFDRMAQRDVGGATAVISYFQE